MKTSTHKSVTAKAAVAKKQYSYNEVVEFLDTRWSEDLKDESLSCMKKLDKAFGNLLQKIDTILVTGTNGKSLTAHFTTLLLKEEGLMVGTFYSPHILTYNERFLCNQETISHKAFTDIGNEVIHMVQTLNIKPHALDVLATMALLYFTNQKMQVAVLEVADSIGKDPLSLCKPKITAITRITDYENSDKDHAASEKIIKQVLSVITPKTHVVSADQSKLNLQIMEDVTKVRKAVWAMPIRKLAPLAYPFEQLHGRSAALAERVAHMYVNTFIAPEAVSSSLLVKQKGQRGRPTLEAKRESEISPKRTVEQFWKDTLSTLPGRFQLLDKENPTVLLDNASNVDALQNLLLGIRLLHYHRPLKGLVLILASNNKQLNSVEFIKQLRYFFKKTSGSVFVCPVEQKSGHHGTFSWDQEKVTNDLKSMKVKARSAKSFKEAFEAAQKTVDERHGLIVVAGSSSLITEYWRCKGMKRL